MFWAEQNILIWILCPLIVIVILTEDHSKLWWIFFSSDTWSIWFFVCIWFGQAIKIRYVCNKLNVYKKFIVIYNLNYYYQCSQRLSRFHSAKSRKIGFFRIDFFYASKYGDSLKSGMSLKLSVFIMISVVIFLSHFPRKINEKHNIYPFPFIWLKKPLNCMIFPSKQNEQTKMNRPRPDQTCLPLSCVDCPSTGIFHMEFI